MVLAQSVRPAPVFLLPSPRSRAAPSPLSRAHPPATGKSSLVIQFIENHFVESYYPTIESVFNKNVSYKGIDYDCDIIDTAGQVRPPPPLSSPPRPPANPRRILLQDEYTILNSKHAIGIHGYVLVYSVTNRKSFDMVRIVYDKIVNFCGMNSIPCVIVGSKIDLPNRSVRFFPGNCAQLHTRLRPLLAAAHVAVALVPSRSRETSFLTVLFTLQASQRN